MSSDLTPGRNNNNNNEKKSATMVLKSFLKKTALLLIAYLSTVSGDECTGRGCFTREMFDVLSRFTDDSRFDSQEMWDRLDKCFDRWSTDEIDLWEVSDSYWKGIIDYGVAGGNSDGSDPWEGPGPFMEFNPTPLVLPEDMSMFPSLPPGAVNITVYEPCNSVSNIAYMRTIMGICEHEEDYEWNFETDTVRALVQSVLFMAPGSFLMHASGTSLGGATDIEGIHQMALVAHQGSLQSIPYDPVLYDVHESARNFTGKEATAYACEFIVNDSVDDWLAQVRVLDTKLYVRLPLLRCFFHIYDIHSLTRYVVFCSYEFSFMALVTTLLNLVFSERIATRLTIRLAGVLLEGSALQFILDSYAPRLREAFAENDVKAGLFTRTRIFVSFIGVLIRLVSFAEQEDKCALSCYL